MAEVMTEIEITRPKADTTKTHIIYGCWVGDIVSGNGFILLFVWGMSEYI